LKIIIAGGTGHVGTALSRDLAQKGHEIVILSRGGGTKAGGSGNAVPRIVTWDGVNKGPWFSEFHDADVVINLAGRTVNCRYTKENLRQMMDSRVDSTRIIGLAIEASEQKTGRAPDLWLQMSTATIYAHRFDQANDEANGLIGGSEPDVPRYWDYSIQIAKNWEDELAKANTPSTRRVALRTAMVMGTNPESVFGVLSNMTRLRLGGAIGGGKQYVSWIHEVDFLRAVDFIMEREDLRGAINICAPEPLPQKSFMRELRNAWGVSIGLPAMAWMAEIGAFFLRTDTELLLKSRRVVPGRLLDVGFEFKFPTWRLAAQDLVQSIQR
jgi:uncharacterized protein (TIGR01777 family)